MADFHERYFHERNYGCRMREYHYKGLKTVTLENELLRVSILADKGADIIEFLYKCKRQRKVRIFGSVKCGFSAGHVRDFGNGSTGSYGMLSQATHSYKNRLVKLHISPVMIATVER